MPLSTTERCYSRSRYSHLVNIVALAESSTPTPKLPLSSLVNNQWTEEELPSPPVARKHKSIPDQPERAQTNQNARRSNVLHATSEHHNFHHLGLFQARLIPGPRIAIDRHSRCPPETQNRYRDNTKTRWVAREERTPKQVRDPDHFGTKRQWDDPSTLCSDYNPQPPLLLFDCTCPYEFRFRTKHRAPCQNHESCAYVCVCFVMLIVVAKLCRLTKPGCLPAALLRKGSTQIALDIRLPYLSTPILFISLAPYLLSRNQLFITFCMLQAIAKQPANAPGVPK